MLFMAESRTPSKRQPVSCEPCRVRKIRCFRDGPPCGTCIRRRVAHCTYLSSRRAEDGRPRSRERTAPAVHLSPLNPSASDATADLSKRVQRLERLLRERSQSPADSHDLDHGGIRQSLRPHLPERSQRRKVFSGFLRTTESGHVRFVARTQQWSHDPDQGDYASSFSPQVPFSTQQPSIKDLLARLPPVTHCSELVNKYFCSFAPLFHVLHDPTFAKQYDSFLSNAETVSLSWLALLFAMLGTAVLALERDSPILQDLSRSREAGKASDLMEHYRSAAMACLEADRYLWNHNITTLQALILLIYSIGHSHGRTWTLLGLTHHLAISLGCHVDPSEFNLAPIEIEERRRCWSGLLMLYTSENFSMGNSGLPHHVLPANCRPPADINDDEIGNQLQQPANPPQATQMTYLLSKFRLYDICSDLCDRILDIEGPCSYSVVAELDATIENEQRAWSMRYVDNSNTPAQQLPVHHRAHLKILHGYANHLILILHQAAAAEDRGLVASEPNWSEGKIVMSALKLLEIHSDFQQYPELAPFRWYNRGLGSFHAFHAATVLFSWRRSMAGRRRAEEICKSLQDCAARFESIRDEAVIEISPLLSKATPVLRHLCSRMTAELSRPTEWHVGVEKQAYTNGDSVTQPQVVDNLPFVLATPSNSMEDALLVDHDIDGLLDYFQPQHWLTPASLPWDHWDTWISSTAILASE